MITVILDGQHSTVAPGLLWGILIFYGVVYLAFYLLRSFGIYAMAKKKELKHSFLAFIPCLWIYTACKLIGTAKCFGKSFDKLALIFCIVFTSVQVLKFFYNFLEFFPIVGNILMGKEIFLVLVTDSTVGIEQYTKDMTYLMGNFYGYNVANPYVNMGISLQTIETVLNVLYYVLSLADIAVLIITITLYISLFRAYVPQHYVLLSVLAIFLNIFPPLVFAIRKKEQVNYNDYLRQRYSAWYANGSYYGGPVNSGEPKAPPTPFEEFADKDEIDPGEPFENFDSRREKPNSNDKKDDDYYN